MKGAKPKHNAIRRGLSDSYGLAVREGSSGVLMPQDIAEDPVQSEIWAWLAPPVNSFTEQDIPTLRLLTYWHAVARQAEQAIHSEDGKIAIFDKIGVKPFKTKDGNEIPLVRKNPALTILKEASSEIRALSDMLGLSPLARSRIGLMDATATKTAADTAAMFKSIDAAYELPESEVVIEDAED
ncbi:MAG: P27 family phage terminase small subunit [Coriobacteriaceae bacterium]|uniref:P27 family phage terminase small subunit n=1 Tax=Tractidigestivibacter sp. TaxID=2847320 RepID=UPI002A81BE12|nr:P27 family phage terminase small subunit [Tractidigestivibacter sp.]MCI6274421.1 P27 family phage terminase small subunit [Coriobacteriaceae bacterium]MCI6548202.1 P27 family phage terminase small subunit [Coriobacteriaceae bacterium]MCI6844442.1 P27 family phage terminase small subunit [Coriobacteriaceae bacterium]MDY4535479.1 P27 family phage terminase small subunit [Tractidigestivibacter sp.]MDY5272136.1 P27 family phage terminase small subunit [Tractidigestivibacter sp.]